MEKATRNRPSPVPFTLSCIARMNGGKAVLKILLQVSGRDAQAMVSRW